jgi:hypothetical protein
MCKFCEQTRRMSAQYWERLKRDVQNQLKARREVTQWRDAAATEKRKPDVKTSGYTPPQA